MWFLLLYDSFFWDEANVRDEREPAADMLEASRAASDVASLLIELLCRESSSRFRVRIMADGTTAGESGICSSSVIARVCACVLEGMNGSQCQFVAVTIQRTNQSNKQSVKKRMATSGGS